MIASNGVVVSELGPGAPPLPEHFPLRNRIISGISLAVVVVEASEKSGSLITARCATGTGARRHGGAGKRPDAAGTAAPTALLKDGAKVVETADDILEELGWPRRVGRSAEPAKSAKPLRTDPLLARMDARRGRTALDGTASATTGLPAPKLLPRLTELGAAGACCDAAVAGGRFITQVAERYGGNGKGKVYGKGIGRGGVAGKGEDHQ